MKKWLLTFLAALILVLPAAGHDGKPHDLDDLWRAWSFDPLVILSLALSASVYFIGLRRLWKESGSGRGISFVSACAFVGGWISMFVALVSPIHPWGEVLFSVHMTQHEILMLISAPLFVLGRPLIAAMWALPRAWRRPVGGFISKSWIDGLWKTLTNAGIAWAVHAIALWTWHLPFLFQATLKSDFVHTLQHTSFFLSALFFWWAIIYGRRGLVSYGAGVLYLFTTSIHSGMLGVFLTLTTRVWYPVYSETASEWGLTPLEDQQLGGLIMWVPAGIVYIIAALVMFAGWLRESEKRVVRRERLLARSASSGI